MRERREHALAQELPERLAGDARDDQAQHHVARVAVGPARSRRKAALPGAPQQRQHLVVVDLADGSPGRRAALVRGRHQVLVVGQPRGVGEQVTDRDPLPVRREGRNEVGERVLVTQLAVAHEQHDGSGRELLGDRGQAESRCRVDPLARAQVAHTVAALEDGLAVLAHEHREPGLVAPDEPLEDGGRGGLARARAPTRTPTSAEHETRELHFPGPPPAGARS